MPDVGTGSRLADRYLVDERIGGGGMGVVFRGRDERLGRSVAIKLLAPDALGDDVAQARLLREARTVAEVDHPAIVHVYDIGVTTDGRTFLVMELVRGRSLREVIATEGVRRSDVARLVLEAAAALGQAHRAGVVHRDIKPENMMLRADGRLAILDFGLAKRIGPAPDAPLTTAGGFVGTPAYMAPEQAEGGPIDGRADQFSLAVTAYEMLAGRLPWSGATALAILAEILQQNPPPIRRALPEEGPEVDAVLARALHRKAAERFATIEEFGEALSVLLAPDGWVRSPAPLPSAPRSTSPAAISLGPSWASPRAPLALPDALDLPRPSDTALTSRSVPPSTPDVDREPAPAGEPRGWRRARSVAAVAAVLALSGGAGLYLRLGHEAPPPTGIPRRLTSAPGWEAEPAISPDGHFVAYVSDEKGNPDVWLVDTRGGTSLRLTDDDAEDRAPTWFPDGSAIAFASNRGGTWGIWKVPRLGGSATPLVENASDPAIAPDGERIAFVRESASGRPLVWVAPIADLGRARPVTTERDGFWTSHRPAWSPDGSQLAYEDFSNLWVVPVGGGNARPLTTGGGSDGWASWSRDGRYLYFSGFHENTRALWRIPARGGAMARITMGTGPESQVSVARGGQGLAYSTYEAQSSVIVVDVPSGARATLPTDTVVGDVGISPDGRVVAYISLRGGSRGLWLQDLSGAQPQGPPRRLTELPGGLARPTFSPDGRWIAVHRSVDGQRDIWTLPTSGGMPRRITEDAAVDIQPAWSPDGAQIAFVSDRSGRRQIWVVPVSDGQVAGVPREITHDDLPKDMPAWSPDGTEMVYRAGDGKESEIWLLSLSAGTTRRVTAGAFASCARWEGRSGALLVSGTWGARFPTLRRVHLQADHPEGQAGATALDVTFGNTEDGLFEASLDGRTLVVDHELTRGDVWVLDAPRGEAY